MGWIYLLVIYFISTSVFPLVRFNEIEHTGCHKNGPISNINVIFISDKSFNLWGIPVQTEFDELTNMELRVVVRQILGVGRTYGCSRGWNWNKNIVDIVDIVCFRWIAEGCELDYGWGGHGGRVTTKYEWKCFSKANNRRRHVFSSLSILKSYDKFSTKLGNPLWDSQCMSVYSYEYSKLLSPWQGSRSMWGKTAAPSFWPKRLPFVSLSTQWQSK